MTMDGAVSLLRTAWTDLREKRLWPVAVVLLAAVVAVPVLLSRSPASPPSTAALPAGGVASGGLPVAAVNASGAPAHSDLRGHGHDPFTPGASPQVRGFGTVQPGSATTAAGSGATASTGLHGATTSVSGGGTGSGTTSTGTASTGTVVSGSPPAGGAPPPPIPSSKPAPAPSGLSPLQSYDVQISLTNAGGGLNRIDPVHRLALLPSPQQPLLVELGVLQGHHKVLFAVAPGTVLYGPGTCVPGPIDCEILSLGEDQIEGVATSTGTGAVAMFAVTGITTTGHPSAAAAQKARQAESAAGRQFLGTLSLPALSLFKFDPGVGAVLDLRNLVTGGN